MVKTRKSKRRALDSNPVMSEEQVTACSWAKCGKTFSEPVELTVRANGSFETYHACPHCFSRLSISDNHKNRLSEPAPNALTETVKEAIKETAKDSHESKPVGCAHFLGYLKKRPGGSPIPDECLTCASIMQCMGFV